MSSVKDNVSMLLKKLPNVMAKRVYQRSMTAILLEVKKESIKRTPVDTGFLKSATFTKQMRFNKNGINGSVYNTAKYSLYVHENLTARHETGQAKFLEGAANEVGKKSDQIVEAYAAEAILDLKRGGGKL